jgi:hypothetical protein
VGVAGEVAAEAAEAAGVGTEAGASSARIAVCARTCATRRPGAWRPLLRLRARARETSSDQFQSPSPPARRSVSTALTCVIQQPPASIRLVRYFSQSSNRTSPSLALQRL